VGTTAPGWRGRRGSPGAAGCSSGAPTAGSRTVAKKAHLVIAFSDATDNDNLDPAAAQDIYSAVGVSKRVYASGALP